VVATRREAQREHLRGTRHQGAETAAADGVALCPLFGPIYEHGP
jgi:hypothetical protein